MNYMDFSPQGIRQQVEENRKAAGMEINEEAAKTSASAAEPTESFISEWSRESTFSTASGKLLPYVVLQVTLKEKFLGTGSKNLEDLEEVINTQVAKGYRLHTMSTTSGESKGFAGGDRIQATLVFERLDIYKASLTTP